MGNFMNPAAPNIDSAAIMGMMAAIFGVLLIVFIIGYIFFAICLMSIAKKTNTKDAWLAWIPFANLYLMTQISKRPWWWLFLLLVPTVDLPFGVLIWVGIAKARGKEDWLGALACVPIANIVVLIYLAFSN